MIQLPMNDRNNEHMWYIQGSRCECTVGIHINLDKLKILFKRNKSQNNTNGTTH